MSKLSVSRNVSGIVAAVAASVTLGAVQLASGRDLATTGVVTLNHEAASENGVNRHTKSDRADMPRALAGPSRTLSIKVDELAATSILIRVPARFPEEAQDRASVPAPTKKPEKSWKATVACEPVVSVLTEVAKKLPPSSCVT